MPGYTHIVIGAGSAGCVLANRLSADPGRSVLLLEAGKKDSSMFIHMPAGVGKLISTDLANWCFYTEGQPHLNNRKLFWPRGKVLGGSSSINGMVYIRGHARDYDLWRQLGLEGWGYSDVLPYFKRAEGNENGGDDFHGGDLLPLSLHSQGKAGVYGLAVHEYRAHAAVAGAATEFGPCQIEVVPEHFVKGAPGINGKAERITIYFKGYQVFHG